ncbi:hypothetical protein ACFPRL_04850 [Pseudoclavibacter helvolus]
MHATRRPQRCVQPRRSQPGAPPSCDPEKPATTVRWSVRLAVGSLIAPKSNDVRTEILGANSPERAHR